MGSETGQLQRKHHLHQYGNHVVTQSKKVNNTTLHYTTLLTTINTTVCSFVMAEYSIIVITTMISKSDEVKESKLILGLLL